MKIKGDFAMIKTLEEATCIPGLSCDDIDTIRVYADTIIIRDKSKILEAITPQEGDAVFWWIDEPIGTFNRSEDTVLPNYGFGTASYSVETSANALTIGKTVGELRDLLAWAKGEK